MPWQEGERWNLGPALNDGYWVPGCAKTTANFLAWFGTVFCLAGFSTLLLLLSSCCKVVKNISWIGKVKPRMVKADI